MSKILKLTEDQRVNINRKMRLGFCIIKRDDLAKFNTKKNVDVQFNPESIPRNNIVTLTLPETQSVISTTSLPLMRSDTSAIGSTLTKDFSLPGYTSRAKPSIILNEGLKSKNTERLKAIVQKFKKHKKFVFLTNGISKAAKPQILMALGIIQQEIKKHMHTLDSFKDSVIDLLDIIKDIPSISELTQQIRVFFENLITEQKQIEFDTSLQDLQKNVDKITRQLGQTKQQGQWYYKKKKRNDKQLDLKEMIYISDLIRQLPKAYLIGVWQIIHQQPFREIKQFKLQQIDITTLKIRKIRQIEYYVKLTLTTLRKSKLKKKLKLEKKLEKETTRLKQLTEKQKQIVDIFVSEKMQVQGQKQPQSEKKQNVQQKKDQEYEIKPMEVQQEVVRPKQLTSQQQKEIAEIKQRINNLEKDLSVSSSDSSMITDDQEDFD